MRCCVRLLESNGWYQARAITTEFKIPEHTPIFTVPLSLLAESHWPWDPSSQGPPSC